MRSLFILCLLSVAQVAATGCGGDSHATSDLSAASTSARIERVVAEKPQRKSLVLQSTQPARIEAFEQAPIFAKLAGYVDQVHVDIGDVVQKDQRLLTLRIPELNDEVDQKTALLAQAEAEVAQAAANIDAVKAAAETAAARVAEMRAGVPRAAAEFERWQKELRRLESLAASGSVTQKLADETKNQLDSASAAREEATAAVESAEAAAREAAAMIAKAEADHRAAVARVAVKRADLARARTMLSYAELKAPFDGVVTSRAVDAGHFVQPAGGSGPKPLLVVSRSDQVRVFLDVPEMEAALVDVGDGAILRVQALGGKELQAKVTRISWSLDPANRSLRAEVDVPNENSLLRPGMYATGIIELDRRQNALTLPATAIVRSGQGTYCCVVEDGKIVRRPLELGLRSGPEVEVTGGIDDGATVVTARADSLTDGQQVEVVDPGAG